MKVMLERAGTNPDQSPAAVMEGPDANVDGLEIGEVVHISGQPDDVKWRIVAIHRG